ncbi:MAG: D-alanine--D-alanine ligase family protein [Bacillota bacterium]|nr:D-alanine--D-alanine ligase family protein [Bacillota bacterium]
MIQKTVAVIFGGRSGEHVVSLRSAASIMDAIDSEKYKIIPVGISREGLWYSGSDIWQAFWEYRLPVNAAKTVLLTDPSQPGLLIQSEKSPVEWNYQPLDIVFPILHGTYGEDGTIQGLFEMAGIPYVGSGVLASSVSMDKVVMKILFERAGLPVASYVYFHRHEWVQDRSSWQDTIIKQLELPCFVKPANLGSSVGITKVSSLDELGAAVEEAFLYDEKVIVDKFIDGREIECSVLGDLDVQASRPGEIIPCNEFYDYRAKYIDDRSELIVPVELSLDIEEKVRNYSIKAFQVVEGSGLARVDFFIERVSGRVIVNEINTMPGFTSISMYPKLWEASGISYPELVNRLLDIAESRFIRRKSLMVAPPE